MGGEALGVRRIAGAADQPALAAGEDVGELDDAVLGATRYGDDLAHPAPSVGVAAHVHDQVDTGALAWMDLLELYHSLGRRSDFERLRAEGRYGKLRAAITARDIELAGSPNPMLAVHGASSEARQYSGRRRGADWICPFHPAD